MKISSAPVYEVIFFRYSQFFLNTTLTGCRAMKIILLLLMHSGNILRSSRLNTLLSIFYGKILHFWCIHAHQILRIFFTLKSWLAMFFPSVIGINPQNSPPEFTLQPAKNFLLFLSEADILSVKWKYRLWF